MNVRGSTLLSVMLTAILLFPGCAGKETRESYYRDPGNPLVIALAYPFDTIERGTMYLDGIKLAVSQLNSSGGVLGREVKLIRRDDESSVNKGAEIAQELVEKPMVAAVIGHWNSSVSIPSASIYESNGMVMLTAASTNPELTRQEYEFIFRAIPNDAVIGGKIADRVQSDQLSRIAVIYTADAYGRGLANAFEERITDIGLLVADRVASASSRTASTLLDRWNALDVDALFIAGVMPEAGDIVNLVRDAGFSSPIYSGTGLDRLGTEEYLGANTRGVEVTTLFNIDDPYPRMQEFVSSFRKANGGTDPDSWSILGYEAVMIIAEGMEAAGSPLPEDTAAGIRSISAFNSVSGVLSCGSDGEFREYALFIRSLEDGGISRID